jgi:hypothetical protein
VSLSLSGGVREKLACLPTTQTVGSVESQGNEWLYAFSFRWADHAFTQSVTDSIHQLLTLIIDG